MLSLRIAQEFWPFREPFRISGYIFTEAKPIVVQLTDGGVTGAGEAVGVYYRGETPQSMIAQIESVRAAIESGITRTALRKLLPPGGARNAVDCALWDLEAKRTGVPAWRAAGLNAPATLPTTYTIGADEPAKMAAIALRYAPAPRLKLKLRGPEDVACVSAVRRARPNTWIGVDANQGFTRASLEAAMAEFVAADVRLIEQPVKIGAEADLEGLRSRIPLAADESVQSLADIVSAKGRFDVVNIKLDKCGGLTEARMMAHAIREAGMRPMVGCMEGTSLAMMPGALLGQLCDFVDMDGAMFLASDRAPGVEYRGGDIVCTTEGWGSPGESRGLQAAS